MFDDNNNKGNNKQIDKNNNLLSGQDLTGNNSINNETDRVGDSLSENSGSNNLKKPNSGNMASEISESENMEQTKPASPQQNQVEDILAGSDDLEPEPVKPAAFQPKQPEAGAGEVEQKNAGLDNSSEKLKKMFALIVIICVVILFGVLGFWGYNKFVNQPETEINEGAASNEPEITNTGEQTKENEQAAKQTDVPAVQPPAAEETPLDTDKDGLSDEEERALGTNINQVDSDGDGLFDLEEVKVYKTDPLNPDTDGDGFLDGAEVKDGYNPNGAGKLYEIEK